MQAKSERFELRLEQGLLDRVDMWRGKQADLPTRAEAVRRLLETALEGEEGGALQFSPAERLIVAMLGDVYAKLGIDSRNGEIDAAFVQRAIYGGHFWALKWELSGLFHDHSDRPRVVSEVVDALDMWDFIELSYEKLSEADRATLEKKVEFFGRDPKFVGYDGNNESEYRSVARFMIEDMKRFSRFAGRDLNSHAPKVDAYRRMYAVFEPIRPRLAGRLMAVDELSAVLQQLKYQD